MKNNKGVAPILIVLIVVGVLVLGGGTYYFWVNKTQKPVGCTQEAKICPDGSAVGRTGPNCEFAECPTVKADETADWKTYRNEEYGFEFKYPDRWGDVSNSLDASVFQSNANSAIVFEPPEFEEQLLATGYPFLTMEIKENPQKLNLEDFYFLLVKEYETKEEFKENLITQRIQDITYYQIPTPWGALLTIFPLNSAFLEFSHHTITLEQEEIFNQMLSTFRFLE